MISKIYLDNNATTKVDEEVYNVMLPHLKEEYGNPSSIYSFGKEVKEEINKARKNVADLLNANPENIIFTSCGSESNVTAIMSSIKLNQNKKHIITTKVEHASIIEAMNYLKEQGYNITYLNVDNNGRLDLNELKESITSDTCLISVMMANNEIGNIYPIKEITKIAHENNIIVHCDAVQAVGKINIDVQDLDVEFLSISGHKINAPKGIGVLYIKDTEKFTPLIFGHQEKNRRGGTENVPYIIGLGKAAELIISDNFNKEKEIEKLRNYMEDKIKNNIDDVLIYGDINNRTPNTSSIAFKGVKADELMLILESFRIFVSTGSACNSEIVLPSHVLTACNADLDNYSPIRISLGKYNTKEEIDKFIKRLINIVNMIRRRG
ncbi:MAG: cysteine desulfurase family protein [Clostridia bacterium]|nr:cysteine desulfurase family protein [Clostridia bacterium]